MKSRFVRAVFTVAGLQAVGLAQVSWMQMTNAGPSARIGHAMSCDTQRSRTVLFGGRVSNLEVNDTWEWDGAVWRSLAFVPGPPARRHHAMAYDSQRRRTVLFGGYGSGGAWLGDTWEWNGITWVQVASAGAGARYGHAMAYDNLRGHTVLFGGQSPGGAVSDTWQWDGATWTQIGTTGPSLRYSHAMVYDSIRDRTVLFGGVNNTLRWGDTWEWDGSTWTLVASTGPSPRDSHAMAYDSFRGRTVLFGGYIPGPSGDTWEWNGIAWTQVASTGPPPRGIHALTYDRQRERTVVFGGSSTSVLFDTWEWRGGLVAAANAFGAGCGNPALTLTPVTQPRINTTAQLALTNVPSPVVYVALGWSSTTLGSYSLPLSLAQFGMPGCDLLQSTDAIPPAVMTGTNTASYSLPLPNWASLIGLVLYMQGWAYAPGANAGNTVVSNGVHWFIGNN